VSAAVFSTAVLDQVIAERRKRWETERQTLLAHLLAWLDENAASYGVTQAYIFGSLAQPGRFTDHSDVDVAVVDVADGRFFSFAAALSIVLERDVDLLELHACHFAAKIKTEGILWTASA
jgi:predicted nucleotidyltransferase